MHFYDSQNFQKKYSFNTNIEDEKNFTLKHKQNLEYLKYNKQSTCSLAQHDLKLTGAGLLIVKNMIDAIG